MGDYVKKGLGRRVVAREWRDETSYARDERGKVDPRSWAYDTEHLAILVHRQHGLDGWFVTCRDVGIELALLGDDGEPIQVVRRRALNMVRSRIQQLANEIETP